MAIPKCPKPDCNSTKFELTTVSPEGSKYQLNVLHCSICGASIGVVEYFNAGFLLRKICKKLGINPDNED